MKARLRNMQQQIVLAPTEQSAAALEYERDKEIERQKYIAKYFKEDKEAPGDNLDRFVPIAKRFHLSK